MVSLNQILTTIADATLRTSLLLNNENIIYASPITLKPSASILPAFLRADPRARIRHLILTDFPRLITLKEETDGTGNWKIKTECIFLARGSGNGRGHSHGPGRGNERDSPLSEKGNVPNVVLDVQEKGSKGFVVQTVSLSCSFECMLACLTDHKYDAIDLAKLPLSCG